MELLSAVITWIADVGRCLRLRRSSSSACIVKPDTFTGWHRRGFRLFWRWKSKPGRPALPQDLRALMRRMALENPTCGQERIAA
jgi:hypothetical protein